MSSILRASKNIQELLLQILIFVVVLAFYAIDRRNPEITLAEFAFFTHLALYAVIISYVFLPKLLKEQYLIFVIAVVVCLVIAGIVEELVLEKIFFPETRGSNFYSWSAILGIAPPITIMVGFKLAWDLINTQREVNKLKTLVKESELAFLKAQINPHFLFNTMNNLYAHALENSPKTPEIILDLSSVLRYMLYDCKADRVPLHKEVEQLEKFIEISKMQIEGRGNVTFKTDLPHHNLEIAPLILIVFIENAFKHSTSSQANNIEIDINLVAQENGNLTFNCKNTFLDKTTPTVGGIGMENVRKRLDLIYPNKHSLLIKENTPPTYEVELQIKL